ncbi:phenylacetate--CoA ligase family protein, partial [Salmonella sp. SAL04281]|uniref:phenylacetate--CoA ligase family protein n=1 Tax=Salmonella sp. SAL04281 TaxID=3159859 RepID=UPI003978624D
VHNTFSYHLTPAGAMVESGADALGCPVIPAGTGQTEQQLRTIADLRPVGYVGTPSFLKVLLDRAVSEGGDVSSLKKALVGAEA